MNSYQKLREEERQKNERLKNIYKSLDSVIYELRQHKDTPTRELIQEAIMNLLLIQKQANIYW